MGTSIAITDSSNNKRNVKIAHAFLKGDSAIVVSKRYGLSIPSCVSILRRYCWRLDPYLYNSLKLECRDIPLRTLREHADIFIDFERSDYSITMDSPIWKINEFNNTIVKALLSSNINTLHDLSVKKENDLKKIPMIGSKSLEIILKVQKMRS